MNGQAAKRYACDRCREQKLRCPREQQEGPSCDRCVRLGAVCVTSSGRPVGRPPLQATRTARGNAHINRSRRGSREQWQQISDASKDPSQLALQAPSTEVRESPESCTASTHPVTFFDSTFNLQMEDSDLLDTSNSGDTSLGSVSSQLQFWSDTTSVSGLEFNMINGMAEGHCATSDSGPKDSASITSGEDDHMTILISAFGSISRNLAELKKLPSESWDPYLYRASLFDGSYCNSSCIGASTFNSWESALGVVTRFILLLQTMVPAHLSIIPARSPPSLSARLMLLSTYIQVGELFDVVLSRISMNLQEGHSSDPQLGANRKPSIPQLPGAHVLIIIQILEHHLQTIEQVLGLPADCRLWSQKEAYGGILGQEECSVFTQTVMEQAQDTFHSLKRIVGEIHDVLQTSSTSCLQRTTR